MMRAARLLITMLVLAIAFTSVAAVTASATSDGALPQSVGVQEPADASAQSQPAEPALTLVAAPGTVTSGDPARLVARVGIPGATLLLSRKTAGDADFRSLGTMTIGADGAARFRALPRQTTTYRVDYVGDGVLWLPASAEVTVTVCPRIVFTATDTVYRGQRARLSVKVGPAHPGGAVVVQQWRDGAWSDWRTVTLDERSRATLRWRASEVGRRPFRVLMAADAEHAAATSAVRRVTVRRPNPYGVPVTLKRIIVVDKSQYRLFFFSYGREVKSFPCVLGRPGLPTPTGRFRIYARGMWPGGPFGARIMSYHSPYAIHGTNEPHLLKRFPRNFSHGCTRLGDANAIWLFDHAPVGTPVWNVP
jgi:lipoprotein-anchoring transpeptidase ErfK/SrfK